MSYPTALLHVPLLAILLVIAVRLVQLHLAVGRQISTSRSEPTSFFARGAADSVEVQREHLWRMLPLIPCLWTLNALIAHHAGLEWDIAFAFAVYFAFWYFSRTLLRVQRDPSGLLAYLVLVGVSLGLHVDNSRIVVPAAQKVSAVAHGGNLAPSGPTKPGIGAVDSANNAATDDRSAANKSAADDSNPLVAVRRFFHAPWLVEFGICHLLLLLVAFQGIQRWKIWGAHALTTWLDKRAGLFAWYSLFGTGILGIMTTLSLTPFPAYFPATIGFLLAAPVLSSPPLAMHFGASNLRQYVGRWKYLVIFSGTVALVPLLLRDFAPTIVAFLALALILFCFGEGKWVLYLMTLFTAVAGLVFVTGCIPKFNMRVDNLTNLENAASDQLLLSLQAFARGGIFGRGVGHLAVAGANGRPSLRLAASDGAVAYIGETLGLVGLVAITVFIGVLVAYLLRAARSARTDQSDLYLKLTGVHIGITSLLCALWQVGLFPVIGVAILFSRGKASILLYGLLLIIAFLLNVKSMPDDQTASHQARSLAEDNPKNGDRFPYRNADRYALVALTVWLIVGFSDRQIYHPEQYLTMAYRNRPIRDRLEFCIKANVLQEDPNGGPTPAIHLENLSKNSYWEKPETARKKLEEYIGKGYAVTRKTLGGDRIVTLAAPETFVGDEASGMGRVLRDAARYREPLPLSAAAEPSSTGAPSPDGPTSKKSAGDTLAGAAADAPVVETTPSVN